MWMAFGILLALLGFVIGFAFLTMLFNDRFSWAKRWSKILGGLCFGLGFLVGFTMINFGCAMMTYSIEKSMREKPKYYEFEFKTSEPLQPTLQISEVDGVSDTVYIYPVKMKL